MEALKILNKEKCFWLIYLLKIYQEIRKVTPSVKGKLFETGLKGMMGKIDLARA